MAFIDLSNFKKDDNDVFDLVKEHMKKFSNVSEIKRIVTCYRNERTNEFIAHGSLTAFRHAIQKVLFFPIWLLLALVPEEEGKELVIGNIVLEGTDNYDTKLILKDIDSKVGKGRLVVNHVTVVCRSDTLCDVIKLREELSRFHWLECKEYKLKVINTPVNPLSSKVGGSNELKVMPGEEVCGARGKIKIENEESISHLLEGLDADIPCIGEDYNSPHTMFGSCYDQYGPPPLALTAKVSADGILIATLGYGCKADVKRDATIDKGIWVLDQKNFASESAPVYNQSVSIPCFIHGYTRSSPFIVCQTTYCDGTVANGATSKAIDWLRNKWKANWQKEYKSLIVLIPYGGSYREDEMKEIHGATDEGIIIVCAAGEVGGDVVFPAALGNVISVGVVGTGPSGREVDISVEFVNLDIHHEMRSIERQYLSQDCGLAAARVTGLLALLLSRIHSILKSPRPGCMAEAIKEKQVVLHTCVIRELLVNEGTGSHDPQEGYGNGKDIFWRLLLEDNDDRLLTKLSDVLLIKEVVEPIDTRPSVSPSPSVGTRPEITPITIEMREVSYHNLTGKGIKCAVIDSDFCNDQNHKGHGLLCSKVVKNISPKATMVHIERGIIARGIHECLRPDVNIISCSMGTESFDLPTCKAVSEAVIAGKIIVFSAGNKGQRSRDAILYPGRIGNVLVIGGQDTYNSHLSFSSVGKELDFLAPAVLGTRSGTSFAAPVIAGYIGLLLQFIKEMSEEDYRIKAWSEGKWSEISIWKAAHNVYAIRDLLKLMIAKPQVHSEASGFGCINLPFLFPSYCLKPRFKGSVRRSVTLQAQKQIHERLQKFYCRWPKTVMLEVYSLEILFGEMKI